MTTAADKVWWVWDELRNANTDRRTRTFLMKVPGGYIVRTETMGREGQGPQGYHMPVPVSTSMVFVPITAEALRDASNEEIARQLHEKRELTKC